MIATRRRGITNTEKKQTANGLYIHSSPPRVLNVNSAQIRQLIRSGDLDKLEQLVLEGQGAKLLGEYSADYKVKKFIRTTVPLLMSKISLLHDAVSGGSLNELQNLLQEDCKKRKLALCKDQAGVGLLHKAIYYDLGDISKYLIENFPQTATLKDAEGRTPVHYTAMCRDPREMQRLLAAAGADLYANDSHGHNYKYYMDNSGELELPSCIRQNGVNGVRAKAGVDSVLIKPSNIRIWIHQRDLGQLQKVLWEGYGAKLRRETSNNPRVKRFLEALPYLMNSIKDIHSAAINNDMELMKERTSDPVPSVILTSKDANGLNALHKAAGLGHLDIAQYLIEKLPELVSSVDFDGRTPLHYAVLLKDGDEMYNMLIHANAEESALDNRQKTPIYYKTRPNEIDSKLLQVIPDAPRIASNTYPASWDWNLLTAPTPEENSKSSKKTDSLFGSTPAEEKKIEEELKTDKTPEEPEPEPKHNGEAEESKEEATPEEPPTEQVHKNGVEATNGNHHNPEQEPKEEEEAKKETPEEEEHKQDEPKEGEPKEEEPKEEEHKEEEAKQEENKEEPKDEKTEHEAAEPEETNMEEQPAILKVEMIDPETNAEVLAIEFQEPEDKHDEDEVAVAENAEEHNEVKSDTPESQKIGVIEGVVNGEDEVETLNNDENTEDLKGDSGDGDTDAEIQEMIEAGNMEQLAAMVLNGEGDKLIGQQSHNPEIQAFLENVPIYMAKINRVHVAARDGSLRDLQAALDRRKFAIARDPISPNGATPLHVATVFGNTSIVRYLAGRFPETLQMQDDKGRTPLHYAATVADNGHYYNLLLHLGANPKVQDKFGREPDYYRHNHDEFSHRSLLRDFGAQENEADDMLSDKENTASHPQVDIPLFRTEEGRYLASSLGDPLIKGLTEVANKRPEDPIAYLATYLYNFANTSKGRLRTQEGSQVIKPETPQQPNTFDVVTVDPDDQYIDMDSDTAYSASARDEHGQSMLHFAAARSHGRNALFQLLQDTDINIGYRDELYRTARDISIQANVPENTIEIDRYIISIAAKGDTNKLVELLLEGYDHITEIVDEDDTPITEIVAEREQTETVSFLHSILAFEERRERVHHAIRQGNIDHIREMLADENETGSGKLLAIGKNSYGRCTLHIAVLCQQEEIVDYLANTFPDTLNIGDNLERTALHYAMGVEKMESISRVLVEAGAKRVMKDLKGRQASYYFMNKSDILRLQEEEETF